MLPSISITDLANSERVGFTVEIKTVLYLSILKERFSSITNIDMEYRYGTYSKAKTYNLEFFSVPLRRELPYVRTFKEMVYPLDRSAGFPTRPILLSGQECPHSVLRIHHFFKCSSYVSGRCPDRAHMVEIMIELVENIATCQRGETSSLWGWASDRRSDLTAWRRDDLSGRERKGRAVCVRLTSNQNAPEAQNVSNRRWSASATSAEPAEGSTPSSAPARAEQHHIQPLQGGSLRRFTAGSARVARSTDGYSRFAPPAQFPHQRFCAFDALTTPCRTWKPKRIIPIVSLYFWDNRHISAVFCRSFGIIVHIICKLNYLQYVKSYAKYFEIIALKLPKKDSGQVLRDWLLNDE